MRAVAIGVLHSNPQESGVITIYSADGRSSVGYTGKIKNYSSGAKSGLQAHWQRVSHTVLIMAFDLKPYFITEQSLVRPIDRSEGSGFRLKSKSRYTIRISLGSGCPDFGDGSMARTDGSRKIRFGDQQGGLSRAFTCPKGLIIGDQQRKAPDAPLSLEIHGSG